MRWTTPTTISFVLLLAAACKPEPPALKPTPSAEPVHESAATSDSPSTLGDPGAAGQMQGLPAGHPPIGGGQAPGHQPSHDGANIGGTVVEVIPAGKYVYLKLKRPEGEAWAAVLQVPVEVGETVQVQNANLIRDFKSPTLGRTIDAIWFGTLADRGATAPTPTSNGDAAEVGVERAEGDHAHRIAEIYEKKADLVGKPIVVRAKVVKYNAGILDRNWLHVQDGTGDAAAGTHDLTVTTTGTAAVGDIVTISGTLALDKDFGAGYRYPVIVEDATVTAAP